MYDIDYESMICNFLRRRLAPPELDRASAMPTLSLDRRRAAAADCQSPTVTRTVTVPRHLPQCRGSAQWHAITTRIPAADRRRGGGLGSGLPQAASGRLPASLSHRALASLRSLALAVRPQAEFRVSSSSA
jgi:hypothetical protein